MIYQSNNILHWWGEGAIANFMVTIAIQFLFATSTGCGMIQTRRQPTALLVDHSAFSAGKFRHTISIINNDIPILINTVCRRHSSNSTLFLAQLPRHLPNEVCCGQSLHVHTAWSHVSIRRKHNPPLEPNKLSPCIPIVTAAPFGNKHFQLSIICIVQSCWQIFVYTSMAIWPHIDLRQSGLTPRWPASIGFEYWHFGNKFYFKYLWIMRETKTKYKIIKETETLNYLVKKNTVMDNWWPDPGV